MTPTIAMIGAGNMGSSLIGGLIKDKHPSNNIWAADTSDEKLAYLQKTFQIHTTTDNTKAVQSANVVILAIKPQLFPTVLSGLKNEIQSRKPLVISVAAGIREASIQKALGGNIPIVRCMPNTPALINCGATALYANQYASKQQRDMAESILRATGLVVWLNDESLMDTVTALSGSGPAYFFLMMESLQQAAEELGLPNDVARLLTLQTALGAARMALESGTSLPELRKNVTSPGGTTEKGLSVLEEHHIRDIFKKAIHAAKLRSEELANLFGDK